MDYLNAITAFCHLCVSDIIRHNHIEMKKITLYIFAVCIFSAMVGCNDEGNNLLPPCDPSILGDEMKFYADQTGVLTFTDTIGGLSFSFPTFFILSDKKKFWGLVFSDGVSYLPLTPCNLPESDYNLNIGDQIDILFSGNVVIYPPTIDATSVPFELTKIQKLNIQDQ